MGSALNSMSGVKRLPLRERRRWLILLSFLLPFSSFSGEMTLTPSLSFVSIEGIAKNNSSHSTLVSKMVSGVDFSWTQVWGRPFRTYLRVGTEKIAFETASNRSLLGADRNYSKFGFGSRIRFLKAAELDLGGGVEEQVMYRALTPTVVQLDAVALPAAHASLTYEFNPERPFTSAVEVGGSYFLSKNTSTHHTEAGTAYRAKFLLCYRGSALRLVTGIYYGMNRQQTDLLELKRTDLGVEVGIGWRIGR